MGKGRLFVVGIGPGVKEHLTYRALEALKASRYVVGYRRYVESIGFLIDAEILSYGMGEERERCECAVDLASRGYTVSLVSSGDPGIFGMASIAIELAPEDLDVEIIPGLPALSFAASKVGVPLGGDFALVSLSDLLLPWEKIVLFLDRVASSDVSIAIVNPGSSKRPFHLSKAANTILRYRPADTPVAVVENACLPQEKVQILKLGELEGIRFTSMNSIVFVGCQRSVVKDNGIVTDRGYFRKGQVCYWVELEDVSDPVGIESASLTFVKNHLKAHDFSPQELEVVARMVHAVADFSVASLVRFSPDFVGRVIEKLRMGNVLILADTDMARAGISSLLVERLNAKVLSLPKPQGAPPNVTRSAWGLRSMSSELSKALLVVGNAPSVLLELKKLKEDGVDMPFGVVGLPVGFVGTCRAKRILEDLCVPYMTVEGNRGGTPMAVAAVNALLRLALA